MILLEQNLPGHNWYCNSNPLVTGTGTSINMFTDIDTIINVTSLVIIITRSTTLNVTILDVTIGIRIVTIGLVIIFFIGLTV